AAGCIDQVLIELAPVRADLFDLATESSLLLGRFALLVPDGLEFFIALLERIELFCVGLRDESRTVFCRSHERQHDREPCDERNAHAETAESPQNHRFTLRLRVAAANHSPKVLMRIATKSGCNAGGGQISCPVIGMPGKNRRCAINLL